MSCILYFKRIFPEYLHRYHARFLHQNKLGQLMEYYFLMWSYLPWQVQGLNREGKLWLYKILVPEVFNLNPLCILLYSYNVIMIPFDTDVIDFGHKYEKKLYFHIFLSVIFKSEYWTLSWFCGLSSTIILKIRNCVNIESLFLECLIWAWKSTDYWNDVWRSQDVLIQSLYVL